MAEIVVAKCDNCGATLEFEDESSIGKCKHCGGEFILTDPSEIHLHDETHHHEHYGTDGKSFSQLKYMKKMLENEIEETRTSYEFQKQNVDALSKDWLEAIDNRKVWGMRFMITGVVFMLLNGISPLLFWTTGIVTFFIGSMIWFNNPSEQYNRLTEAEERFEKFKDEATGLIVNNQTHLKRIKDRMLEVV